MDVNLLDWLCNDASDSNENLHSLTYKNYFLCYYTQPFLNIEKKGKKARQHFSPDHRILILF